MDVAIIGGGAAGFFAAITAKENHPDANVVILEKSQKILSKVKISGGGRCNVTNGCSSIGELSKAYPRGERQLKKAFGRFSNKHAFDWFESRGVPLVVQSDNCVFPVSQNSQSIIDCFLSETSRLGIEIRTGVKINSIQQENGRLKLEVEDQFKDNVYDKVIVATGGSPKRSGLKWLELLGHEIAEPVPSLFTFNMPDESVKELMGIVVEETLVNIQGTKLRADGPLLITHWGMSGPAILKLSAFGARILSDCDYQFKIQVNWVNEQNSERVRQEIYTIIQNFPNKMIGNYRPYGLKERLWHFMLEKSGLSSKTTWSQLGRKSANKLIEQLTNDTYSVSGKTTFKEEFVTCGGVCLNSVDFKTMQSKVVDNLYFAGEVLDVDGITGGYNFQAAWTTGYIAGKLEG